MMTRGRKTMVMSLVGKNIGENKVDVLDVHGLQTIS